MIIGYGNTLRGEDAFGIDVIQKLESLNLRATKLITVFTLTPELVLELLHADEIIFIDACYDIEHSYTLACGIKQINSHLSHHIVPSMLIALLYDLYDREPQFFIYSMLTHNFDTINDIKLYESCISHLVKALE